MASLPFKKIKLNEGEVSVASLPRPPGQCKLELIKRFLQTRGIPSHGRRKELVKLAESVIEKKIPVADQAEKGRAVLHKAQVLRAIDLNAANIDLFPVSGWKNFPSMSIPIKFDFGSIYKYLLESAAVIDSDGEMETLQDYGAGKPLARGRQYFRSGHVKQLQDALNKTKRYCVKGVVKSSMKDRDYNVIVVIDPLLGDVLDAECHCRGSAMQRCSHVAAVLIAVEDYSAVFGFSPPACTSQLCSWNQGGKEKRPDPLYMIKYSNLRDPSRAINFDTNISTHPKQVHNLQVNNELLLLARNTALFPKGSKWGTILDFQYEDYSLNDERRGVLTELVSAFTHSLTFGFVHPTEIPNTRDQSDSLNWQGLRRLYITASVVKKFLKVPRGDVMTLLRNHMWYPQTFSSKYTTWGIKNEENGKTAYIMQTGNIVKTSGLWINPSFPGLAASPDGVVFCNTTRTWGVLEVKCPYILKDDFPTEFEKVLSTQQKSAFCLKSDSGNITIKRTHQYYYQIQMVMGVVGVKWCDFCIWTSKGVWLQRVPFDETFWLDISKELLDFHKRFIAVEYFEMRAVRWLKPVTIQ